jgi:hypothetical protein
VYVSNLSLSFILVDVFECYVTHVFVVVACWSWDTSGFEERGDDCVLNQLIKTPISVRLSSFEERHSCL